MANIACCEVELNRMNNGMRRVLKDTMRIFREASEMVGSIVEERWDDVKCQDTSKDKLTYVESLIHTTKNNQADYPDFDKRFYKFPAYYRRSVINFVVGQVRSYHTRLDEYEERRYTAISSGKKFKERRPILNLNAAAFPSMYKDQMYILDGTRLSLKVRIRNTWDWVEVSIPARDKKYLENKASCGKVCSPKLLYKFHKFYLSFPIEYGYAKFPETPVDKQIMLAVDLGVNRGAVASLMDSSGTILGRFFDPFTSERDQMNHLINKIKKIQRATGTGNSLAAVYTKLNGVKTNYTRKLANWIASLASTHHVYGIVLEYLGKMKGSKSARIHHWCKCRIRDMVKGMCFRNGIKTFLINPRNTSALAFDGSGKVERDKKNYSMCMFSTGKRYHCDLSASYNIGARYFLRAYFKAMPETEWSGLMAKVPELSKRTSWTLSTLIRVDSEFRKNAA